VPKVYISAHNKSQYTLAVKSGESVSTATAVDLLKKGATLLKEPCTKCGGVQVRYKNRTFCVNCGNLLEAVKMDALPTNDVIFRTRDLVIDKIQEATSVLKNETDVSKQADLADLILKYIEIVEKIKTKEAK